MRRRRRGHGDAFGALGDEAAAVLWLLASDAGAGAELARRSIFKVAEVYRARRVDDDEEKKKKKGWGK